jgi:hypothetical protein
VFYKIGNRKLVNYKKFENCILDIYIYHGIFFTIRHLSNYILGCGKIKKIRFNDRCFTFGIINFYIFI